MIDANLIFDGTLNPVAGAAITATRDSTNVIDFLVARDMGAGEILGIHVDVMEAFLTATSLQVDFQISADNNTYKSILLGNVVPIAQLIIGAPLFRYALPVNQIFNATAGVLLAPGRYCKLVYTIAGSNATAGKVFSYVNPRMDRAEYYTYPENFTAH